MMSQPVGTAPGTVDLEPAELDPSAPPYHLTPRIRAVISLFDADANAHTVEAPYRGDTLLLVWNVQTVIDGVRPHLARMAEIAQVPVHHFETLPLLARAVHYSDLVVRGTLKSDDEKASPMPRIRELRRKARYTAELAVMAGFVDRKQVEDIKAGRDREDLLTDGLRYDELFADKHDLLVGPLVISHAELTELAELCEDMLGNLQPRAGRKRQTEVNHSILERNRKNSLLVARYNKLRDVLPAVVGWEEAKRLAPPLYSRASAPSREEDVLLPELEEEETPSDA